MAKVTDNDCRQTQSTVTLINGFVCLLSKETRQYCPRAYGKLGHNAGRRIIMGESNHCGGAEWLWAPKSPNNVSNTFFNAVHLLPKDLRFEHWDATLASCPGRHLTSLRPYSQDWKDVFKSRNMSTCANCDGFACIRPCYDVQLLLHRPVTKGGAGGGESLLKFFFDPLEKCIDMVWNYST